MRRSLVYFIIGFLFSLFSVSLLLGSCVIKPKVSIADFDMEMMSQEDKKVTPIYKMGKYASPFPPDEPSGITPFRAHFQGKKAVTRPPKPLPVNDISISEVFPDDDTGLYVTWLGHSSILLQINGIRIFIDPVFTDNISPIPFIKIKRYQAKNPILDIDLPELDAVVISHSHYDHLDKKAIKALKNKTKFFITPENVGKYLEKWGVEEHKIKEFSWWEEGVLYGQNEKLLTFICTPARHFSGRGLYSINNSLWASFLFFSENLKVFYSGDTSYSFHFKQIGYHYGPMDLALMECGQYNEAWLESHQMPEESVKANLDVQAKYLLPIHWGSFTLAKHDWWEPVERAYTEAEILDIDILTPRVGQTLLINENTITNKWWEEYK